MADQFQTRPVPQEYDSVYFQEELQRIEDYLAELKVSRLVLDPQYAEPDKLEDGLKVFADGTTWNPGSGAGEYVYWNGKWYGPKDLITPVYDDYVVSGVSLTLGASSPTLKVFRDGLYQNAFAGSGPTESAHFTVHLLHGLAVGTDLNVHVHWGHIIASPTGNVKWQFEYTVARGYGVGTFPASTTLSVTQAAPAQYVHQITSDDDMVISTGVEIEPDSVLLCRIFRDSADAADTFANDAYVFQVDMHYQRGQIGTLERNRTWDSAGY